ncbi:MAG: cytochrome c peroxidase [Pseudomonadales bacterium]
MPGLGCRALTGLRLFVLLLMMTWPGAGLAQTAAVGPGDVRDGYEREDYRTRSAALTVTPGRRLDLAARALRPPLGLAPLPRPLRREAVDLGRALFFDRRLSVNGTLSCAMCHVPEQAFTQNELRTPVGLEGRQVRRNAPSLYNVAYRTTLFHDGREATLEAQIWAPLLAPNEMGNVDRAAVLARIGALDPYPERFAAVYGAGPTEASLSDALASYQRGLLSGDSPFDRWRFGRSGEALDARARRGFEVFQAAGCAGCHVLADRYAEFTDDDFHNTGIAYRAGLVSRTPARLQIAPGVFTDLSITVDVPRLEDAGRFEVTGREADRDRYRTPSLRNVALTGPYMHDGAFATLAAVVDYYDAGGSGDPNQDARVRPLGLPADDKAALLAFLESLTGSDVEALAADARSVAIGDRR